MPTNVPDINDLNLGIGVAQITLGGNMTPVTYYMESWDASITANTINVPNEVGKIRGRIGVVTDNEGTALLQLPNTSSASLPKYGCTGSVASQYTHTGSVGGTVNILVTGVSAPKSNNSYWTTTINWVLANP